MRLQIDWASLIVRSKFAVFALFYFVFESNFPSTNLLRIISCAFFLKELFVRANRKCIFTGNYVTRGKIDSFQIKVPGFRGGPLTP